MNFVEDIPELNKRDDWQKLKAAIDEVISSMTYDYFLKMVKLPPGWNHKQVDLQSEARRSGKGRSVQGETRGDRLHAEARFQLHRYVRPSGDSGYASYGANVSQRKSNVRPQHEREDIFER